MHHVQAGEGSGSVEEAPELLPLVQVGILPRGATAVPPAMTRRVLELLAHLAKHTVRAAPELISLRIRPAEVQVASLLGTQARAFLLMRFQALCARGRHRRHALLCVS